MSSTLKQAIRTVETRGISPLRRVANTRPKSGFGADAWRRWNSRRAEVESRAIAELKAAGIRIRWNAQVTHVSFGGIEARSTAGLLTALSNWRGRARDRERNS